MDNKTFREKLIGRTYAFSLSTILLIKKLAKNDLANDTISKQLIRSATSIGANIVEAQEISKILGSTVYTLKAKR